MNAKTKAKFECIDCSFKQTCIQDIYDDAGQKSMKIWAKADKKIAELLKAKRGI